MSDTVIILEKNEMLKYSLKGSLLGQVNSSTKPVDYFQIPLRNIDNKTRLKMFYDEIYKTKIGFTPSMRKNGFTREFMFFNINGKGVQFNGGIYTPYGGLTGFEIFNMLKKNPKLDVVKLDANRISHVNGVAWACLVKLNSFENTALITYLMDYYELYLFY